MSDKKSKPKAAEQLKPCPFCGSKKTIVSGSEDFWWCACISSRCLCDGPQRTTERAAIKAWNSRKEVPK